MPQPNASTAASAPRVCMPEPNSMSKVAMIAGRNALGNISTASTTNRASAMRRRDQRPPPTSRNPTKIGRASCRERVCQYGVDLGGRRIIKKNTNKDLKTHLLYNVISIEPTNDNIHTEHITT